MPAAGKMAFVENEKALCFHGPLMYEAKVQKSKFASEPQESETGELGAQYFVHYKGWKNSWDEWVPEERLLKWNEENVKKQKMLMDAQRARDAAERQAQQEAEAARRAREGGMAPGGSSTRRADLRGQKRGREGIEGEDEHLKRPEIKISIPDVLKAVLVDDWELVTRHGKLVPLPRTPSVNQILDDYRTHAAREGGGGNAGLTGEVVAGLKLYFTKCVGNNLLYRFERGRYQDYVDKNDPKDGSELDLAAVYGAEHLLRLFVNLPELIAHTTMDPETVAVLREQLATFLKWFANNKNKYFGAEYETMPLSYSNMNRT